MNKATVVPREGYVDWNSGSLDVEALRLMSYPARGMWIEIGAEDEAIWSAWVVPREGYVDWNNYAINESD